MMRGFARTCVEGNGPGSARRGFSLIETVMALSILALTCVSIMVVVDRSLASAADLSLQASAFEVARENLEQILVRPMVKEEMDSGASDRYPAIKWQTTIESFAEPTDGRTWVRAISAAEYEDAGGQIRKVELVHWLTDVTDQQLQAMNQDSNGLEPGAALASIEDAAAYAQVDAATISQWLDNGLIRDKDGSFVPYNLDIFIQAGGQPSETEKSQQVRSVEEPDPQGQTPVPGESPSSGDQPQAPGRSNSIPAMPGAGSR